MIRESGCSLSGALFGLPISSGCFARPSPLSGCAGLCCRSSWALVSERLQSDKGKVQRPRFAEPTALLTFVLWIGMQRRKARGKMNE